MIEPTHNSLDPTALEDLLAEIGARLLAGERLHGSGSSFSLQVDLAAAARPLVALPPPAWPPPASVVVVPVVGVGVVVVVTPDMAAAEGVAEAAAASWAFRRSC